MTSIAASTSPAVQQAPLPANLRTASPERKEEFRQALAFERVLLGQMVGSMMKTTGGDDKDTPAAVKAMKENLPGLLADALTASGGIGLAAQLDASSHQGETKQTSLSDQPSATASAPAKGAGGITA